MVSLLNTQVASKEYKHHVAQHTYALEMCKSAASGGIKNKLTISPMYNCISRGPSAQRRFSSSGQ